MDYHGITLDPFQEEAIHAIEGGRSVLISAPTGAGKTLIAEFAIEKSLEEGKRLVYTAPIKALSSQKFRDFTARYGERIGIKTGDVTINPDAQIVLMTTEVFRNTIFDGSSKIDSVEYVVLDEIHFLDDPERGTVWEESIIFAPPSIRFICLSATIPNIHQLASWIKSVRGDNLTVITESRRPVPLAHTLFVPGMGAQDLAELRKREKRMDRYAPAGRRDGAWRRELVDELFDLKRLPAIYFAFNRRECEQCAASIHRSLLSEEERTKILDSYDSLCRMFSLDRDGVVATMRHVVSRGVAYHHAGLLPTLKEIVERLFTGGILKILFATETFALGVNMPARTVVFSSLSKFNGVEVAFLKSRDFQQMAGRAGRRGMDEVGYVYSVLDWPHTRALSAERVITGDPEPVCSQFNLSYSAILGLYGHLQEKIYGACEKSFSVFQGKRDALLKLQQMKKKIDLLKSFDYIRDGRLTERGIFASQIYGYEIPVAELLFRGILDGLSETDLAVVFCAIIFDGRKSVRHRKVRAKDFRRLTRSVDGALGGILRYEKFTRIAEPMKEADFRLAPAVIGWMRGETFDDLERHTEASAGDIVRTFRQTIQLVRQTASAVGPRSPLRPRLLALLRAMNRDEVDAERQLRLGIAEPVMEENPKP
ncbi:MAG: hypothetical protein A2Z34_11655 [Planctomycetes bacterium RBG_16_59_8]|nr:MAG: hypothetical protein A2Z34_11655 [Planctomycetes bacterium RBG_16_59_8]